MAAQQDRALSVAAWPAAAPLTTERLLLEPLAVEHAPEMAPLLDDPALHAFIGGEPLTPHDLRRRYERQARGASADGTQRWLNWIVRGAETGAPVGTVQATVTVDDERFVADLAWMIATPHRGHGYATEAASAMAAWLGKQGADVLAANIHPRHEASMRVARALGLAPTTKLVDGEVRWAAAVRP